MGTIRQIGTGRRIHPSIPARASTTVALIAHDAKKEDLARFIAAHHRIAHRFRFLAPEDTARALDPSALEMEVLAPDTMGGDLQVAAAVVEGRVDAMIFLHDPLAALPSEPAIATMLKACDLQPIPLATNLAAAEILFHHLAAAARMESLAARHRDEAEGIRIVGLLPRLGENDPAANH